jgi:type I restriction enzyme S subunit
VSNEFPCFAIRGERADGRYLWRYFSRASVWTEALGLSAGGTPTSRNRLKEERLLAMEIPLPPVSEQRRIVARVEELAAKIEEARGLRQQAVEHLERLMVSTAHRTDLDAVGKHSQGWAEVSLGEILRQVHDYRSITIDAEYPNFGIYSFGKGLFPKPPIDGASTSAKTLNQVHTDQFIYSRLFAFEGAYGRVPERFDGWFVSNEYPTFECDSARVTSGFLFAYFKAPSVWSKVAAGSKGLGHRRQRVQPEQLLAHRLMLPPMEWQSRIGRLQKEADALKRLQAETAAELDALLPSVLDKAFKGEL